MDKMEVASYRMRDEEPQRWNGACRKFIMIIWQGRLRIEPNVKNLIQED
jgi:hypothetical protein